MRTLKIIGFVTAILGLLTATIVLITEIIKLNNEIPTVPPSSAFYTLRIEFSTTSQWSVLQILDASEIQKVSLVGATGNAQYFEAKKEQLSLVQTLEESEALKEISVVADFDISGNSINNTIPFLLKRGANNISIIRFYKINDSDVIFLQEIRHDQYVESNSDENPFEFVFDLRKLK